MLRITTLKSASDYYTKSLTKGDYYSEQFEISGQWQGLGSKKLGLFGEIKKEQFDLICAGHHPLTGEQLSSRIATNRREAYDFTFSVPKSMSVLSAVASPEVATLVQDQINESMKFTMVEVEKNIQTRIRESGKNDNRVTGNITYGYFLHKNARPIDGYSDPHLHIHAVVMNLTFDGTDKKWKAIQMRDKHENRTYYQSIFNSTFANRLQNLGIEVRKTPDNFDLAGITDQTIKTFSRRTDEIEKEAIAQNIHNVDAKGKLGARTRQSKSDRHSQSQLQVIYQNLLSSDQKTVTQSFFNQLQFKIDSNQIDYELLNQNLLLQNFTNFNPLPNQSRNLNQNTNQLSDQTQKWLDYTLENHYERHSTSSEQRLIGEILKNGIGQTNLELVVDLIEKYKKDGILIDELSNNAIDLQSIQARNNISPAITTQVALLEEQNIVRLINSGIRLHSPISVQYSDEILNNEFLNQNQKEVVSKIFTNSDGVTLIEGKAGTGKTTTLKSIETGLNKAGYSITVLAPTTKAVEVLQLEGFENAMTISRYLVQSKNEISDQSNNQSNKLTQYLIVDEASLVSVRQLNQLLEITNQNSQRVLLVGDTKQHKSVERGNILKTIQDYSQIRTYSLNQIQRQVKNDAKLAVEDLSRGNIEESIQKFQKLGFVQEIQDDKTRLETVAKLYTKNLPKVYKNKIQKDIIKIQVELLQESQQPKNLFQRIVTNDLFRTKKEYETQTQTKLTSEKIEYQKLTLPSSTLVITPTHKDGQDIHIAIRRELKTHNLIGTQDYNINTIRSLTWTNAQKSEISNYQPGYVIQFSRNIKDFKIGDRFEVLSTQNNVQTQNPKQDIFLQNTKTGENKNVPVGIASYFDVYQKETLTVSKHDLIQLQSRSVIKDIDGKDHKTANGGTYQIKLISSKSGDLTLTNNWVIPKDFGTIKSAYYSTSQASQGQTVNHSIFYTSNQSLPLLNQEMVYVANSRFKQSNMILTPDLAEFKAQAQKGEIKSVALEVILPKELAKPEVISQSPKIGIDQSLSKKPKMKR